MVWTPFQVEKTVLCYLIFLLQNRWWNRWYRSWRNTRRENKMGSKTGEWAYSQKSKMKLEYWTDRNGCEKFIRDPICPNLVSILDPVTWRTLVTFFFFNYNLRTLLSFNINSFQCIAFILFPVSEMGCKLFQKLSFSN